MKKCKRCGKDRGNNKMFCSISCANSVRKHSLKTKEKIALGVEKSRPHRIYTNTCSICGVITEKRKKTVTCSRACLKKRLSLMAISSGSARKAGLSSAKSRKPRSRDEIELFEMVKKIHISPESNASVTEGTWDADIIIRDKRIAIAWNGPWHYREMGHSNHSLKQVRNRDLMKRKSFKEQGWKFIVFEDRHWTPESAFEVIKKMVVPAGSAPTL